MKQPVSVDLSLSSLLQPPKLNDDSKLDSSTLDSATLIQSNHQRQSSIDESVENENLTDELDSGQSFG